MEAINSAQLRALMPYESSFEPREQHPRFKSICNALLRSNGYGNEYRQGKAFNSYNPHKVKVWALHNEFGLFALAIGAHLEEALDNAVDNDCMNAEHVAFEDLDEDEREQYINGDGLEYASLGNAGELFDLQYFQAHAID